MEANIKSIAVGKIVEYDKCGNIFKSAYKKDQFFDTIEVTEFGLNLDKQADKKHHGGIDKAVHIGSYKHFKNYEMQYNKKLDKLAMGCNIFIDNFVESDINVGDIYSIGDVKVEVTQPRQPCWKIGALFGKDVSRFIIKNSATGWYVKILQTGNININDKMVLQKRVSDINIKELLDYLKNPPKEQKIIDKILSIESLANSYKKDFKKVL